MPMTEQAARNTQERIRIHLEALVNQPSGYFTHFPQNQFCDCDNWEDCEHEGSFKSVVYRVDDNLNFLSCEVTVSMCYPEIELHTATSELVGYWGREVVRIPFPKEVSEEVEKYFENELAEAKYNY